MINGQSSFAYVNNIIPISTVDGPGARTSIFLQNCNIKCKYCHNPETQNFCIGCGECVLLCPTKALTQSGDAVLWDKNKCVKCDECIRVCPHFASPKVERQTPADTLKIIEDSGAFIRGISVSGGECCLNIGYLTELFRLVRQKNLTCLIDTNGTIDLTEEDELMAVTDGVMLDVKSWDSDVYYDVTLDRNDDIVRKNLKFFADEGKLTELRIVVIPGKVDADRIITQSAKLIGEKGLSTKLKLIAFRPIGVRGEYSSLPATSDDELQRLKALAQSVGFKDILTV